MKCRTCGNDLQGNEYNCPFCGSCVDYTQAVEQAKAGREEGFTFLYENTYRNKLYIAMKYMKNISHNSCEWQELKQGTTAP